MPATISGKIIGDIQLTYYSQNAAKFYCPSSNATFGDVYFSDGGICNVSCQSSCIEGDSQSRQCVKGNVVVQLDANNITFGAHINVLTWKPDSTVSSQCTDALAKLREAVLAHESKHVSQMQDAVDRFKARLSEPLDAVEISSCGDSEEEAYNAFAKDAKEYATQRAEYEAGQLTKEYAAQAEELDQSDSVDLDDMVPPGTCDEGGGGNSNENPCFRPGVDCCPHC